jgi:hypothetical protein
MSVASYILGIAGALATLIVVIELLRRRQLRERHAALWLIAGTLALIAGIFPNLLSAVSKLLGVGLPTNLVFFVSIAILVLVCLQHSAELTRAESKIRTLAESISLLERRVRDLEATPSVATKSAAGPAATSATARAATKAQSKR